MFNTLEKPKSLAQYINQYQKFVQWNMSDIIFLIYRILCIQSFVLKTGTLI